MKPVFAIALLPLVTWACALPPATAPLAEAAGTRNCIGLNEVVGQRVVGPGTLLFETAGPVNFSSRLAPQCPAAAAANPAAVTDSIAQSSGGGQLCAGDRVRLFDPVEVQNLPLQSIPTCVLGRFEPVPR